MLEPWHSVNTSDPLLDSDEELPDGNLRVELQRRLGVITRLRGKSPTPSPPPGGDPYEAGVRPDEGSSFEMTVRSTWNDQHLNPDATSVLGALHNRERPGCMHRCLVIGAISLHDAGARSHKYIRASLIISTTKPMHGSNAEIIIRRGMRKIWAQPSIFQ
ncbi:hypothetical protein OE88DRAFT_126388 [Heliocybe sulcata]|uniref:Uncharacterized protein n=1 Tax=Heliocybe sulcata TaxID=5364 RepID=A0A5C3NHJ9_9AGAM|nr:hypothetical protein OE88DRAFT_126388 [Heliocybe sulcata]